MDVSKWIDNILDYYKKNPGCDPNVEEYIRLCEDLTQYLAKKAFVPGTEHIASAKVIYDYANNSPVYQKFEEMMKQFFGKLLGNDLGITDDSPLYNICWDVTTGIMHGSRGDTVLRSKLGDLAFNIAFQKRNIKNGSQSEINWNVQKLEEIKRLNSESNPHMGAIHINGVETPSYRQQLLDSLLDEYENGTKTL